MMTHCPECRRFLSVSADHCPHCGCRLMHSSFHGRNRHLREVREARAGSSPIIVFALMVLGVLFAFIVARGLR